MSITSHPSGTVSVGDQFTLTCTVEVLTSVDINVQVAVSVLFTAPRGLPVSVTTSSVSGSTYTSTAVIPSWGREQSGLYTCTAKYQSMPSSSFVTDSDAKSARIRVTVGR